MNLHEKNDYIDTMKPIFCLMKMMAILPVQFTFKDYGNNFMKSKITLVIGLCLYYVNLIYTMVVTFYIIDDLWREFSMKVFIALTPSFLAKISIFIVPWAIWNKSKQIEKHWSKWRIFQIEYEKITGNEFVSETKPISFWSSIMAIYLTIIAEMMGHLYLFRDHGFVGRLSEGFNIGTAYVIGAYWFTNYMYSRSCAMRIFFLVKETLAEGTNHDRLNNIIYLWVILCELVEQFNILHSTMFLIYIGGSIVSTILFAYISMNYSKYSDAWGKGTTLNSTMVCGLMVLVICEIGYSVYKEVNLKQKRVLLECNTIQMNAEMLQCVTLSSNIISTADPEIHLDGFFALNRAVFPTILAVCINYLIILRQIQPGTESIN